jgi:hypothetical protein
MKGGRTRAGEASRGSGGGVAVAKGKRFSWKTTSLEMYMRPDLM